LDEIIQAYGKPDLLFNTAYKVVGILDLIWKLHGFVYSTKLSTPGSEIKAATCGGSIIYFPVGTSLQNIHGIFADISSNDQFVPWHGYGSY
jgi:hypothetical protein